MTTTINFTTVTNSIAALSITGVTIYDIDELPDTIGMDTHVLMPGPNFITDVDFVRDELTGQKLTMTYTVHYRYFHCLVGTGGLLANYSSMVTYAAAIALAFASDASLTGALDNDMPTFGDFGIVLDPVGKNYHGFDISLRIKQFLEV